MADLPPESEMRLPSVPNEIEETSFQQAARGRLVALPLAMGLILLGVLLLLENQIAGFDVTLPIAILILVASLVLTNLFRFFALGRQERGLFFLALVLLFTGITLALMIISPDTFEPSKWYPLILVGIVIALLITYLTERHHEYGLVNTAVVFGVAASAGFLVSLEVIPDGVMDVIQDYFPLLIAFLGVTLVPLALRRPME